MHSLPLRLQRRSSRLIRNAAMDLRYGGFLGGSKRTAHERLGAAWTVNTDYAVMPRIFDGRIRPSDVLVDVGCGKGRVINWWLSRGYGANRIVGIDLDEAVADKTRQRLRRFKNVTIIAGNALEHFPADGTLFYLYNPFTEPVQRAFMERLWERISHPESVRVLYYAPHHIGSVLGDARWEVEEVALDLDGIAADNLTDHDRRLAVIRMSREALESGETGRGRAGSLEASDVTLEFAG